MTSVWSVCGLLCFAVFGAQALILQDDPLVDKVKNIIADLDDYISSNGVDKLDLPNEGSSPPVQLTNGWVGDFSTIVVQDATGINETKQDDGSTLYNFDIKVGLSELAVHYDFDFSLVVKRSGNFSLAIQKNSVEVSGTAVVESDSTCEAKITGAKILTLGDYSLTMSPDNMPGIKIISKAILSLISPILVNSLNKAVQTALAGAGVNTVFSTIACPELV